MTKALPAKAELAIWREMARDIKWHINDASYKAPEQLRLMYPRGFQAWVMDRVATAMMDAGADA